MSTMPALLERQITERVARFGGQFRAAEYFDFRDMGLPPEEAFAVILKGTSSMDRLLGRSEQGVCFINAAEAVYARANQTRDGRIFVSYEQSAGLPTVMSAEDALHYITLHELYHCAAEKRFAVESVKNLTPGEVYYRTAVDETLADLAAVLHYASREGSFQSGMATISGFRAATLNDPGHSTEDMLAHILERLSLEQFQGMSTAEVFKAVNQIGRELDPMNNQALKEMFARSVAEKTELAVRLWGPNMILSAAADQIARDLHVDTSTANVEQRASYTLDAVITAAVKIKEIHREVGIYDLAGLNTIAEQMGVELPVYQQARIAVFDSQISPPGSAHVSPFERDNEMKVIDHFYDMLREHLYAHSIGQQQGLQLAP